MILEIYLNPIHMGLISIGCFDPPAGVTPAMVLLEKLYFQCIYPVACSGILDFYGNQHLLNPAPANLNIKI